MGLCESGLVDWTSTLDTRVQGSNPENFYLFWVISRDEQRGRFRVRTSQDFQKKEGDTKKKKLNFIFPRKKK